MTTNAATDPAVEVVLTVTSTIDGNEAVAPDADRVAMGANDTQTVKAILEAIIVSTSSLPALEEEHHELR